MRRLALGLATLAMLVAASGASSQVMAARALDVTQLPFDADQVTASPDGNIWFSVRAKYDCFHDSSAACRLAQIGRIDQPTGAVRQFGSPYREFNFPHRQFSGIGFPYRQFNGITPGPDGNLWFVDGHRRIGRITPNGRIKVFPTPRRIEPVYLAAGPDRTVWFTERLPHRPIGEPDLAVRKVGKITPAGKITEFELPGVGFAASALTAGPDGNVWVALRSTNGSDASAVARITPTGAITKFALRGDVSPMLITAGPDGNIWLTVTYGNAGSGEVARVTPAGQITYFPIPHDPNVRRREPASITAGTDGNLWFGFTGAHNEVARITPNGIVTPFNVGDSVERVTWLAAGTNRDLWLLVDGKLSAFTLPR